MRLAEAVAELPPTTTAGTLQSLLLALPRPPAGAPQLAGHQFHFQHAQRGELRAGYGEAALWQASGPDRLNILADAVAGCRWLRADPDETGFDAFAMIGFAADEESAAEGLSQDAERSMEEQLPSAMLWVPEIGLVYRDHEAALVFSAPLPAPKDQLLDRWSAALRRLVPALYQPLPGPLPPAAITHTRATPDQAGWSELVDAALSHIDNGAIEKVVLSRRVDVAGPRDFDIGRLLGALGCLYPSCQVLSLRRDGRSFVAATPERLLHLCDGQLEVDAIAGTAARAESLAGDEALRDALLCSDKNLREHRVVIDAIRAALAGCCDHFEVPATPRVMQLTNAQHLWSPIAARPRPGVKLFELAERLHPTPATNGQPRADARQWLRRVEPFARGWFTGTAGILEPDGTGELWVLLRCAQVSGAQAELFAGAGIVAGSDAVSEWSETEAKLAAMLSALRYA